jgi:hypothetical protein
MYAPLVREARLTLTPARGKVDRKGALRLAEQWDQGVEGGWLRPLRQVSFEDSPTDGARGSITRAKSAVVAFLMEDADSLKRQGHNYDAVNETLLAIRLSESLKYCDFTSVSIAAQEEKKEVSFLGANASMMSPKSRQLSRYALRKVVDSHHFLISRTRASSASFYDYEKRMGPGVSASAIRQTSMLAMRVRTEGKAPNTLEIVRKNYLQDDDNAGLDYLRSLRIAWRSEHEVQLRVAAALQKI